MLIVLKLQLCLTYARFVHLDSRKTDIVAPTFVTYAGVVYACPSILFLIAPNKIAADEDSHETSSYFV